MQPLGLAKPKQKLPTRVALLAAWFPLLMRDELPLLAPREALQQVIIRCDLPSRVLRWTHAAEVTRTRRANFESLLKLAAHYEDICRSTQHATYISGLILFAVSCPL